MATTIPKETVALVVDDTKSQLQQEKVPLHGPESNQVLVEVMHVAQNPTDVQSFETKAFGPGSVYGCDFTGKAVAVGDGVKRVAVGDIIAGLIWGGEKKGVGAYSQHTFADEKICFKPPSNITLAEASTVPLASATAWLALFSKTCLNMDRKTPQTVLIWGGSSSVGQYAIQLAAIYSFNIITTCSSKNFDLVKSLGANHVFDYNSPDVVEKIKAVAPDLTYIFDTIGSKGSPSTSGLGSRAVTGTGKLCTVRPGKANTEDVGKNVEISDVLVWTVFLKDHRYGTFHWPPSIDDHELGSELFDKLSGWLESGKIKPNPVLELKGLESIPKGFELHKQGKISAQKIVYQI